MDELVEVNVKPKTSLCCDNEDCCTQDVDFQSLVVETQKNLQFLASPSAKFILLYSILPIEDRNHLLSEGLSAISYRDIPYPEIHFSTDRYISIQSLLI
ncbi:MAG: hypothetical protein LAT68_15230 [Cyclobacteriaceae bacterium]|nr:hypothetical protein [Cyclobacteriaceae bacterium]MCH8517674.1 hypothetical protein [Cyclobacteriaceae bacterium]